MIDLMDEFRGLGITIQGVEAPFKDFLNVFANGLVNLAHIGMASIQTLSNNIQLLGDAFRHIKSGDLEGAKIALSGLTSVSDNLTLTWKDYTATAQGAARATSDFVPPRC